MIREENSRKEAQSGVAATDKINLALGRISPGLVSIFAGLSTKSLTTKSFVQRYEFSGLVVEVDPVVSF